MKHLQQEMKTFRKKEQALRKQYANGGYVVIKGGKVLGIWQSRADALQEGIKAFGPTSFLVRDIFADDTPIRFNRDFLFV